MCGKVPDKLCILLVEDRPDNLEPLKLILELEGGYSVDTARTAGETISKIHARCSTGQPCYGLISLDIDLPDARGTILALFIRAKYPQLPFVFLTGYGRQPAFMEAAEGLHAPLLSKPVDPEEYLAAIREAIAAAPQAAPYDERRSPERPNESGQKRRHGDAPLDLPEIMKAEIEAVAQSRRDV